MSTIHIIANPQARGSSIHLHNPTNHINGLDWVPPTFSNRSGSNFLIADTRSFMKMSMSETEVSRPTLTLRALSATSDGTPMARSIGEGLR